jgi:hypothetical protein
LATRAAFVGTQADSRTAAGSMVGQARSLASAAPVVRIAARTPPPSIVTVA